MTEDVIPSSLAALRVETCHSLNLLIVHSVKFGAGFTLGFYLNGQGPDSILKDLNNWNQRRGGS